MILSFFSSILKSDFLILNSNIKTKNIYFLEHKKNLKFLNIFLLNKSLRQFIKCLVYALNKKIDLTIHTRNLYLKYLIYELLEYHYFKIKVNLKKLTNFISQNQKGEVIVFLDNSILLNSIFLKFFKNSVFLISKITTNKFYENNGIYRIFNVLNSFKKIIFFSLIIKKLLIIKNVKI